MSHQSDDERHPPRQRDPLWALTLIQFSLGGLVLFLSAAGLEVSLAANSAYDGGLTLIGWFIGALLIALSSMIAAMLVGLPLRLVPALRARWLAHGEGTLAGAALGIVACTVASRIVGSKADAWGTSSEGPDVSVCVLVVGWALFAISVAHFVWPSRWTQSGVNR